VKTYSKRIVPVVALLLAAVLALISFSAYAAPDVDSPLKVAPTGTTTDTTVNNCPALKFYNWTKGWIVCDEGAAVAGQVPSHPALVKAPAVPALGIGSAQFVSNASYNGPHIFNAFEPGLPLSSITALSYQTYSASTAGRPGFFVNIDYDLTDAALNWQGRLVLVPHNPGCTTLTANAWDTLDVIANPDAKCFYHTGTPWVGGVAGPKLFTMAVYGSWNEVKTAYPNAGIHPTLGGIGLKLGSGFSAPITVYADNLILGYTVDGSPRTATWDFEPGAAMTVAADTPDACATNTVTIGFEDVPGAYGYQFEVSYDKDLVTPSPAFVNSLFNSTLGSPPSPEWNANCSNGSCKFGLTLLEPASEANGTGPVATIGLTAKKAGTFNLAVSNVTLTDRDGMVIQTALPAAPLSVGVCGTATVSGRVNLQGRATPIDGGTVTLTPSGGGAPITAAFDGVTGNYSLSVNYPPAGGAYTLSASHWLYLRNEKVVTFTPTTTQIIGQNTRLLGGDADNNAKVELLDLTCIGGFFGTPAPWSPHCGGHANGSPDINLDAIVNIQDLSIAGGNFDKVAPQNW